MSTLPVSVDEAPLSAAATTPIPAVTPWRLLALAVLAAAALAVPFAL
ncbi:MAG: hypothetical protein JWQ76_1532, partial [Ramlibacter sp.]|nr:hypothetical protein [Ramlibacter sp.]